MGMAAFRLWLLYGLRRDAEDMEPAYRINRAIQNTLNGLPKAEFERRTKELLADKEWCVKARAGEFEWHAGPIFATITYLIYAAIVAWPFYIIYLALIGK